MREVEMPSESLQKLRELELVECICLLVQKVGLSPASASKEALCKGQPRVFEELCEGVFL